MIQPAISRLLSLQIQSGLDKPCRQLFDFILTLHHTPHFYQHYSYKCYFLKVPETIVFHLLFQWKNISASSESTLWLHVGSPLFSLPTPTVNIKLPFCHMYSIYLLGCKILCERLCTADKPFSFHFLFLPVLSRTIPNFFTDTFQTILSLDTCQARKS